jgi:uncharacterized protein (TIGR03435 family)
MLGRTFFLYAALAVAASAATFPALTYSTYLRDSFTPKAIATDSSGNIYIAGYAIVDPAALQTTVLVAKLNPQASQYLYVRFLGGSVDDYANALTVDAAGNVYIAGSTISPDFPVTTGGNLGTPPTGSTDPRSFVAKLDPNGNVVFSNLLGGSASSAGQAVAVNAAGQILVSGNSISGGFPSTAGAYSVSNTANHPYLLEVDNTGTKTIFSATGIGGSAIALDSSGNIYVAGTTYLLDYPTTPGAYQTAFPAFYSCIFLCQAPSQGVNQYVTKVNATGSKLIYSTSVSGSYNTVNKGLAVDAAGNVYLTGYAGGTYPYTVVAPLIPSTDAIATAYSALPFLSKLDPLGETLLFSAPVGGTGVQVDSTGAVYAGGGVGSQVIEDTAVTASIPALAGVPTQCLPNQVNILRASILCLWAVAAFGQIFPTVPQPTNVDLSQGAVGEIPPGWNMPKFVLDAGYRAERREQGCGQHLSTCVAYVAPPVIGTVRAAELQQTFPAEPYIGKSIRFSALLRIEEASAEGYVHIRMRIDYENGKVDMRDSVVPPVTSPDWQLREVFGHVNPGAVSISIWARYVPSGFAWVAAPSFGVVDEAKAPAFPTHSFGVLTASFPVKDAAGKMVRYTGWIKTGNVSNGYAGLWWRVDGEQKGQVLSFDNSMARFVDGKPASGNGTIRGATGSTDWARYQIELPVPVGARNINFGLLFTGTGTAWFDSLGVELNDELYSDFPFDFDFESPGRKNYFAGDSAGSGRYTVGIDNTAAFTGQRSMKMQFAVEGDGRDSAQRPLGKPVTTLDPEEAASAKSLSFEVASVKRGLADKGVRGGCHGIDSKYAANQLNVPPLGQCVITNGRLSHFISIAWGMATTANMRSEPDWIARGNDRYAIEAQAADPQHATEDQLLQMLQNLLIDRFHLKYYRETVEQPGFALVIGDTGSKLQESTAPECSITSPNMVAGRPVSYVARRVSMELLADYLRSPARGAVIDKTGLPGEYDFTLAWNDDAGPSLGQALQDQLGLRLAPQRVSIPLFVVDSAQKPDSN